MDLLLILKLIGVPAIFVLGSLFHFIYKYGGKKPWMAVISPVNESIWEHLKIAFYPALLYSLVQFFIIGEIPTTFFTAEIIGIYCILVFILIAEWIYPAILKRNILIIDLFVFFIAILIGQIVSYLLILKDSMVIIPDIYIALIILAQVFIFAIFSFKPPKLPLFKDSVDGKYGIK